ncbi:tyrosine-protein phosphatase [Parasphaerochaeta coccoides]|uniref:Peptidoglycan-binding lysin domain protein n=1 Tax=Parasphaerochaeta coccoides (strain ATCC BAA-1237 / DSM 17374 / SPN1) TaxID=760011 RepID=F4GHJ4_PARC1|nr:tyrosine-protein phosphatase [Parasphaerochaeta coccoides]AEC02583.1 peptidoglycan-binding lysin domain protein [Parasphaerochaeta coccoides DSM 17374]
MKKFVLKCVPRMFLGLMLVLMLSCRTTSVQRQEPVLEVPVSVQTSAQDVVQQEAVLVAVQGAVQDIDKYGNITADIAESAMTEAGYALGDILAVSVGDRSFTAPYVSTYSDVDRGQQLVRISNGNVALAISYGNFAERTGAVIGSPVSINLAEKKGYLREYEVRHLEKSEERAAYASDEIFANFRYVKAGKIPPGRLYRSANPVLNDARAPYAAKLAELAGVKTVINLADSEASMAPNLPAAPYYEKLVGQGSVIPLSMDVDFFSADFTAKLKTGLLFMAAHEGPYLIHCNEGKDRAGMVVALLEALMDATVNEIVEDYMITYGNYFFVQKGEERYDRIAGIITDLFVEMNAGNPVTDANIRHVAESYLLNTVGLTEVQIGQLKARLF